MCVIGKRFSCNIMHEPGYFARISDEFQHYIVFKVKPYKYKENKKNDPHSLHIWYIFLSDMAYMKIKVNLINQRH